MYTICQGYLINYNPINKLCADKYNYIYCFYNIIIIFYITIFKFDFRYTCYINLQKN